MTVLSRTKKTALLVLVLAPITLVAAFSSLSKEPDQVYFPVFEGELDSNKGLFEHLADIFLESNWDQKKRSKAQPISATALCSKGGISRYNYNPVNSSFDFFSSLTNIDQPGLLKHEETEFKNYPGLAQEILKIKRAFYDEIQSHTELSTELRSELHFRIEGVEIKKMADFMHIQNGFAAVLQWKQVCGNFGEIENAFAIPDVFTKNPNESSGAIFICPGTLKAGLKSPETKKLRSHRERLAYLRQTLAHEFAHHIGAHVLPNHYPQLEQKVTRRFPFFKKLTTDTAWTKGVKVGYSEEAIADIWSIRVVARLLQNDHKELPTGEAKANFEAFLESLQSFCTSPQEELKQAHSGKGPYPNHLPGLWRLAFILRSSPELIEAMQVFTD